MFTALMGLAYYSVILTLAMLPVLFVDRCLFKVERWIQYGSLAMMGVYPLSLAGFALVSTFMNWQAVLLFMRTPGHSIELWLLWFAAPSLFLLIASVGKAIVEVVRRLRKPPAPILAVSADDETPP